jgi:hypothetical protein
MNRMLGKVGGNSDTIQKKASLIDPDALGDANQPTTEAITEDRSGISSHDSDVYGDSPSTNPAFELMHDKELESVK